MAETKIYIDDAVDRKLREEAMARFGYGRGSISSAAEEAIVQWLRRNGIIKKRLDSIVKKAKGNRSVVAVMLFGSYARREHDYMDVDVAILLEKGTDKRRTLSVGSELADRHEDGLIDVSVLNDMPLDSQSKVLNDAEVLYVSDKAKLYKYSIGVVGRSSDFKARVDAMLMDK